VHAADRAAANELAKQALCDFLVVGVATTIPFHLALLDHADVKSGDFDIHWVEHHMAELTRRDRPQDAAVLAALMEYRRLQKVRSAQSRAGEMHFDAWSSSSLPRLR
jgi:acetyl/propionyl-CoA carboxylase alpha subunit